MSFKIIIINCSHTVIPTNVRIFMTTNNTHTHTHRHVHMHTHTQAQTQANTLLWLCCCFCCWNNTETAQQGSDCDGYETQRDAKRDAERFLAMLRFLI